MFFTIKDLYIFPNSTPDFLPFLSFTFLLSLLPVQYSSIFSNFKMKGLKRLMMAEPRAFVQEHHFSEIKKIMHVCIHNLLRKPFP